MGASAGRGSRGGALAESTTHDDDRWTRDGREERWGGEEMSFKPIQVMSKRHTFELMLPSQLEECSFRTMQLQQSNITGDPKWKPTGMIYGI